MNINICGLLGLLLALSPLPAWSQVLQVYTWADIMDFSVIEDFEAQTGLRVEYHTYRRRKALEARLAQGMGDLDLIMLPDDLLARLAEQGALRPLNTDSLEHWQQLHPGLVEASASLDPLPRHGVPYFWGVSGLLLNTATVRQHLPHGPLNSLSLLLEPNTPCGVWIPDAASEVIPTVLRYLGEPTDSGDPTTLAWVATQLERLRPTLAGIHSLHGLDRLASGDACLALVWSDGAMRAQELAAGLDFQVPQEGARLWLDLLAIPTDAPHPQEALALLAHLLAPTVSAQVANYAYLAPANAASWPLLLPEIRDNPAVLPPEPPGGFYSVNPEPAVQARWEALWEAFKNPAGPP